MDFEEAVIHNKQLADELQHVKTKMKEDQGTLMAQVNQWQNAHQEECDKVKVLDDKVKVLEDKLMALQARFHFPLSLSLLALHSPSFFFPCLFPSPLNSFLCLPFPLFLLSFLSSVFPFLFPSLRLSLLHSVLLPSVSPSVRLFSPFRVFFFCPSFFLPSAFLPRVF